jgi:outer membrane protein OmpA-like peptidoglycan-associated protein
MREISANLDGDGRSHSGAAAVRLVMLTLWLGAPVHAEIARLETSTDTQRNGRELQKWIDELSASVIVRSPMFARSDVLFATGTAELDAVSRADLEELAGFLIEYPNHIAIIEGHTDDTGTNDDNHLLSQRRADAVKSYLVDKGVDSKRLWAFGKGEGLPVADNGSESGRQQNRRAAVLVQRQARPPSAP